MSSLEASNSGGGVPSPLLGSGYLFILRDKADTDLSVIFSKDIYVRIWLNPLYSTKQRASAKEGHISHWFDIPEGASEIYRLPTIYVDNLGGTRMTGTNVPVLNTITSWSSLRGNRRFSKLVSRAQAWLKILSSKGNPNQKCQWNDQKLNCARPINVRKL